jgi:hypothetical protein
VETLHNARAYETFLDKEPFGLPCVFSLDFTAIGFLAMKAKMSALLAGSTMFGGELLVALIPSAAVFVAVISAGFYANDMIGSILARTFTTF